MPYYDGRYLLTAITKHDVKIATSQTKRSIALYNRRALVLGSRQHTAQQTATNLEKCPLEDINLIPAD